ncbi:hypothetical protein Kpol_1014p41 [Vanderwaltozyma polyspora DSM 70294]|uniref:Rab-GAP TBC domain-containing protein n=1 Tax=Vanderwaltozyma polyspora (strain ATCC 22028 / DSM 70294 / BCRC 21397 / CBS 2163 / NBRC 10782 / NRRL Y-8283 / UCD 57-17) TaxID=436907 RepID=A7TNG8_VANPO|nr:uncharacterized protein Kpol_1014p41 [Vanderwaltozyma polyspora DSM 70294]EDO16221.1 hypothetical protein Kpol_1014p41 [Vanderwaltozyma polyspora DSM 70294]
MSTKIFFCKSKVFIHPSKSAADNVSGFLIVTNEVGLTKAESVLTWVPEDGLSSSQLAWLEKTEMSLLDSKATNNSLAMNSSILSTAVGVSWSFSVKLNSLYSIQFRTPSPSGWWYGSVIMHSRSPQEDDALPIIFFHDDLCTSTIAKKKNLNESFDPFDSSGDIYWGAVDFKNVVADCVDLQRTVVDSTIWLVNATLDDLRNFSPQDDYDADIKKDPKVPSKSLWESWEAAKWGVMAKIADATSKTGTFMTSMIRKHPLVKLAERNADNPYVKKLLENPRVQEIQDDFDSARVYLAKWALGVKEQSDRYNFNYESQTTYRQLIRNDLGMSDKSDIQFTELELSKALERNHPLTRQKWESFFDAQGRMNITVNEMKDYIFHGGVESMELRKEVWLYLFGVYPWDSSTDEKIQLEQTLRDIYINEYKSKWMNRTEDPDPDEEEYWRDQIFRIEKDVKRNDRHIDLYKHDTEDGLPPPDDNEEQDDKDNEESETWSKHEIKNPHLIKMKNILISYNTMNPNLGYVQGMTDLLSPIYYIIRDEALSFWCFVNFMERMERNFMRDQSGIRDQMLTLSSLCQIMLPQLSSHLSKCDSSNLFFCFRMILVWFKREFEFNDVCSIWEIFLTDYYSSQFQLFFMLAILQKNSNAVIQNLSQFDQILKYFNDIGGKMDWNDLMTRSELLFIRFKKMMDLMERQKEKLVDDPKDDNSDTNSELPVSDIYLQLLLSKKVIIEREGERTKDSIK